MKQPKNATSIPRSQLQCNSYTVIQKVGFSKNKLVILCKTQLF